MHMKILFIHQNFPGQFRHLAPALAELGHQVAALSINQPKEQLRGVSVVRYAVRAPANKASTTENPGLSEWDVKVLRGQSAAEAMQELERQGFVPDIVFAHPGWGEALFVKDVFPETKLLVYTEYFYGAPDGDYCFDPEFSKPSLSSAQQATLKNTHLLHALSACDGALSPTAFQKMQHPRWAQERITVIHDGIDTEHFRPDPATWVSLKSAKLTLRPGDEVVTFVARQLEPYRGYHVLMRSLPLLQKLRPNARIVIVGEDGVSYGNAPPNGETWKSVFLKEVAGNLDMRRVHFVGRLPHPLLTRLMQVSAAHVYLTYPFVLSWSLLEAMSIGALIIGSNTLPVQEVIEHERNGLLTDFFDPQGLAHTVADALDNSEKLAHLRVAARETIVSKYDLRSICLPGQIGFVLNEPR